MFPENFVFLVIFWDISSKNWPITFAKSVFHKHFPRKVVLHFSLAKAPVIGLPSENMGKGCRVPGCKSQYNPSLPKGPDGAPVSLFRFILQDEELLQKWLRTIPHRQKYKPKESSRICSLHFDKEDMVRVHTNSNSTRCKANNEEPNLNIKSTYLRDKL